MRSPCITGQILRFAGVGVSNSALYFAFAALLSTGLGLDALTSSIFAYIVASILAFLGHKFLTFRQPKLAAREVYRFISGAALGLALAALIPTLLQSFVPMVSFVVVLVVVPMCSFLVMKFFVFCS